jgi:hypothetical protein
MKFFLRVMFGFSLVLGMGLFSCDNDPETITNNAFVGIWTKDDDSKEKIYVFENEIWESKYDNEYEYRGTCELLNATTIRMQVTHEYDGETWSPEDEEDNFTATLSGNKVTIGDAWPGMNGTYTLAPL